MRAVITVIGQDMVGIIAKLSAICADRSVNIIDISQSVLKDLFAMIMLVDIDSCNVPFSQFVDEINEAGQSLGLTTHTMHKDIFDSMHSI